MTRYNSLNVTLSNSQLNKSKSTTKNETGVVSRLSLNMAGDDEINFPHKLLLTNSRLQFFVKLLVTNHQLISNYQKLNY